MSGNMKRLNRIALMSVLLLTGCAAKQTPAQDTYGNAAYSITCPVARRQMCIDQAYQTCPNGYHLVDQDDKGFLFNSILVRCK